MSLIRKFIDLNKNISIAFDNLIDPDLRIFGTGEYDLKFMPKYLKNGQTVFDIGGGKNPNVSQKQKDENNLTVIGMDIDANELKASPKGLYDKDYVCDITKSIPDIEEKADIVLCRSVMEHVQDTYTSLDNIGKMMKPGAYALIFAPCRNALFSRINMVLPERFKVKLLRLAFPEKMHRIGFKAYYNKTTPNDFKKMAEDNNFEVAELNVYWASRYFEILFPFHIIWRLYQLIVKTLGLRNFCESFVIVLKKK